MDYLTPVLQFIERSRAQRIRESEFDGLSNTMYTAWNHPHKWIPCSNYDDGIRRVICVPKVSKKLTRYWLWGYDLTCGRIHWQNTKYPYV